jgi:ubiquinone/menaquinone biosynthesis C-methylase UbiE
VSFDEERTMSEKTAISTTAPVPSPWGLGDFHVIGAMHTVVGEILCDDCHLGAGARVLDVACGSGNTALAAARRGASVSGVDLVEKLIARARVRAHAEGFEIDFQTGNAEQLPYDDASFDFVISTFGVMFALDQERAAAELLRVCKPGGTIALSTWTVESFPGSMFALSATYGGAAPGMQPPTNWGTMVGLQHLFRANTRRMRVLDRCTYSHFPSIDEMVHTYKKYFGPMQMLFERVPLEQRSDLERDIRNLMLRYNRAVDGTQRTAMTYINVIMTKP